MGDAYRAVRRFERMFPGIAHQERLRTTDPEEYQRHMRELSSSPVDLTDATLISEIVYSLDEDGKPVNARVVPANKSAEDSE